MKTRQAAETDVEQTTLLPCRLCLTTSTPCLLVVQRSAPRSFCLSFMHQQNSVYCIKLSFCFVFLLLPFLVNKVEYKTALSQCLKNKPDILQLQHIRN